MCAAFVAVSVRGCPAATGPLAGVATGARAVTDGSSDGDEDGDALGLPLGDALGDALGLPLGDAVTTPEQTARVSSGAHASPAAP